MSAPRGRARARLCRLVGQHLHMDRIKKFKAAEHREPWKDAFKRLTDGREYSVIRDRKFLREVAHHRRHQ